MDNRVLKHLVRSGAKAWHDAGFRGVSHTTEEPLVAWNTESDVSSHGFGVSDSLDDYAPMIKILRAGYSRSGNDRFATYLGKKYEVEEFIDRFNVKVITRSIGGPAADHNDESEFWIPIRDRHRLIFNNSIGNDGSKGADASFPADLAIYWCAIGLSDRGAIIPKTYSSEDDDADFSLFTGIREGTSFSSPAGTGMEAVVIGRYDDDMTQEEIYKYFQMICQDIHIPGFDHKTGWGFPILPRPDKRYISVPINKSVMMIDGKTIDTVVPAELINERMFIPLRAVAEQLGYEVTYQNKVATIAKNGIYVKVKVGSDVLTIGENKKIYLDAPAYLKQYGDDFAAMMVPLRAVNEGLGSKVDWVQKDQKAIILEV